MDSISLNKHFSHEKSHKDIAYLKNVLPFWWANRIVHEELDGVDLEYFFEFLDRRLPKSKCLLDFAVLLREAFFILGDGHLRIGSFPQWPVRTYQSGLCFKHVQEGLVLYQTSEYYRKKSNCPRPGDLLHQIDSVSVASYLSSFRLQPGSSPAHRNWLAVQALSWQNRFPGETPAPSKLTLHNSSGNLYTIKVQWRVAQEKQHTPWAVSGKRLTGDLGLLTIRTFSCRNKMGEISDSEFQRLFESSFEESRHGDFLLIDLRGNSGGRDEQALIAARTIAHSQFVWHLYQHINPWERNLPKKKTIFSPYQNSAFLSHFRKIGFLIDSGCFSTAEIFAASFYYNSDTLFFGQTSGGGAGNPQEFRLPNSGLSIFVPVTRFFLNCRKKTPLEGNGLKPDLLLEPTVNDIKTNRDRVLQDAIEYLCR